MEKAGIGRRCKANEVAAGKGWGASKSGKSEKLANKNNRSAKAVGGRAWGRSAGEAKWTVMVYMAGGNNLDGADLRDSEEMARVGSTKDVNVFALLKCKHINYKLPEYQVQCYR